MPAISAYVKRSFVLALLITTALVALLVFLSLLYIFLPNNMQIGFVIVVGYFYKQIGFTTVLTILAFLSYKAYRVFRNSELPRQEFINMTPAILIWLATLGCTAYSIERFLDHTDCQSYNYNDRLNGGAKEFHGKKYIINLCGDGVRPGNGFLDMGAYDQVRLDILNEEGGLLAKRYFFVFWGGSPGHRPIEIKQGEIIYYDAADENDSRRRIAMPPTMFDWIRARIF